MTLASLMWSKSLLDTLYAKATEAVVANIPKTEQVCAMLGDAASQEAYRREFAYKALAATLGHTTACRLTGGKSEQEFVAACQKASRDPDLPKVCGSPDPEKAPSPMLYYSMACTFYERQYACADIHPRRGDTALDCGACFGDTAAWLAREGAARIVSFEIDPHNCDCYAKTVAATHMEHTARLVRAAVGAESGTLYYTPNPHNPGGGVVGPTPGPNGMEIPVVRIDDFCHEADIVPDFIKMDIEGAEFDALRGAEQVIRTHKPRLAVCLYHRIDDMWRIPLLLKQFVPEYRFYCKKSHPTFEFVLLAGV